MISHSNEIIDDDVEKEKTTKKKTTTFDMPKNTPLSTKVFTIFNEKNMKEKDRRNDLITLKDPELTAETNSTKSQRTIESATVVVIINDKITTSVTLHLRHSKCSTNLNVLKAHKNIFSAIKLIDPTIKLIAFQNETIDTSNQSLSSAAEYTSRLKQLYKCPKSSHVYISYKIECASPLAVIKYRNRQKFSNIIDILVTNSAYLTLNKFRTHEEHSIGFFVHINPKVNVRDDFRNAIQDELKWIDLNDEESAPMIHQI